MTTENDKKNEETTEETQNHSEVQERTEHDVEETQDTLKVPQGYIDPETADTIKPKDMTVVMGAVEEAIAIRMDALAKTVDEAVAKGMSAITQDAEAKATEVIDAKMEGLQGALAGRVDGAVTAAVDEAMLNVVTVVDKTATDAVNKMVANTAIMGAGEFMKNAQKAEGPGLDDVVAALKFIISQGSQIQAQTFRELFPKFND